MDATKTQAKAARSTMSLSVVGPQKPPSEPRRRASRAAESPRDEPTSHIWTRSHVTIFVRKVVNGSERIHASAVDLAPFQLSKGSLLSVVLRSIPCPTHRSSFGNLSNALDKLKFDPEAKELLRALPAELTSWQIVLPFAVQRRTSAFPVRTTSGS